MDLTTHRATPQEQARISDLFELIPRHGSRAIDIGARDGCLTARLAERFSDVTALDLEKPEIELPGVTAVKGDAAALDYPDRHFDTVLCAEVLEHIPTEHLAQVCQELTRVCRDTLVVGVPYRQDVRIGRTTCRSCGTSNPPWGHINSFDEDRLRSLFSTLKLEGVRFVGSTNAATNPLSAALLDYAGNPFGTWEQEETCIRCGSSIGEPIQRNLLQKIATHLAAVFNAIQKRLTPTRGHWIHVSFRVRDPSPAAHSSPGGG